MINDHRERPRLGRAIAATPDVAVTARLARLERQLELLTGHFGIIEPEPQWPQVVALLREGKKIQAIALYREATALPLSQAKDAVEEMARRHGL